MTTWESVGASHYGELKGVEQYMQVYAARRFKALINIVAQQPGCRRLTVNEGRRSRPRQSAFWSAYQTYLRYGTPWAALAAQPFTSRHDEVLHGNAGDLGGPNGEALSVAELQALDKFGPALGVTHTGLLFRPIETWHFEALTTSFTEPAESADPTPYVPPATPTLTQNGDDMFATQITSKSASSALPVGAKFILDIRAKTLTRVDTGASLTAAQKKTLRDEWNTLLTAQANKKPISWSGANAESYKLGGYTTNNTW